MNEKPITRKVETIEDVFIAQLEVGKWFYENYPQSKEILEQDPELKTMIVNKKIEPFEYPSDAAEFYGYCMALKNTMRMLKITIPKEYL